MAVGGLANNRKAFGVDAAGRRPSAAHLQPRAAGVLQGRAGMGRASRRRAGAHRRAARRHHHRRRDRRADGGLDRGAAVAQGLSAAAARDLRQVRHPADLRRGHHRLRPARPRLRRRALRRRPRHDHVRQGRHLRQRADGRRDRAQGHPRRLHARAGARRGVLPRLHLFGASAGLRRRPRRARSLPRRGPVRARARSSSRCGATPR